MLGLQNPLGFQRQQPSQPLGPASKPRPVFLRAVRPGPGIAPLWPRRSDRTLHPEPRLPAGGRSGTFPSLGNGLPYFRPRTTVSQAQNLQDLLHMRTGEGNGSSAMLRRYRLKRNPLHPILRFLTERIADWRRQGEKYLDHWHRHRRSA